MTGDSFAMLKALVKCGKIIGEGIKDRQLKQCDVLWTDPYFVDHGGHKTCSYVQVRGYDDHGIFFY